MKASNLKRGDRFRFYDSEAEWSFVGRKGDRYRAVGVCFRNKGNWLYFSGQDVVRVGNHLCPVIRRRLNAQKKKIK